MAVPRGMVRWSPVTEFIFHAGVLFHTAYLSDPSKRFMSLWVFIAMVLVPFVPLLFFRHGEFADETVARAHLLAAIWYLALTMICCALAFSGYRPLGWVTFLVVMAPGAGISLRLIGERLRDPPSPSLPTE